MIIRALRGPSDANQLNPLESLIKGEAKSSGDSLEREQAHVACCLQCLVASSHDHCRCPLESYTFLVVLYAFHVLSVNSLSFLSLSLSKAEYILIRTQSKKITMIPSVQPKLDYDEDKMLNELEA